MRYYRKQAGLFLVCVADNKEVGVDESEYGEFITCIEQDATGYVLVQSIAELDDLIRLLVEARQTINIELASREGYHQVVRKLERKANEIQSTYDCQGWEGCSDPTCINPRHGGNKRAQ